MKDFKARIKAKAEQYRREYVGSPEFWADLHADWCAGKFPHPDALAKAIRSGRPLPPWAAEYVAGLLDGTAEKRPKGPPDWSAVGFLFGEALDKAPRSEVPVMIKSLWRRVLAGWVFKFQRRFEDPRYLRARERQHRRKNGAGSKPPKLDAYREARKRVSKKTGVTLTVLDHCCYPRDSAEE